MKILKISWIFLVLLFVPAFFVRAETVKIYAIGDSLTSAWGMGYTAELANKLGSDYEVVNKGIDGNTTTQMLARFQGDVLDHEPDYVIIWGGINDVGAGVGASIVQNNLQSMYTKAHNAGAKVISINITPYEGYTTGAAYSYTSSGQKNLDAVNSWISSSATSVDYKIDMYSRLEDPQDADRLLEKYSYDWLHINVNPEPGHQFIADTLYSTVGFSTNPTPSNECECGSTVVFGGACTSDETCADDCHCSKKPASCEVSFDPTSMTSSSAEITQSTLTWSVDNQVTETVTFECDGPTKLSLSPPGSLEGSTNILFQPGVSGVETCKFYPYGFDGKVGSVCSASVIVSAPEIKNCASETCQGISCWDEETKDYIYGTRVEGCATVEAAANPSSITPLSNDPPSEISYLTWEAKNASKLEVECIGDPISIPRGPLQLSSAEWEVEAEETGFYKKPQGAPDGYPGWFYVGSVGTETCTFYPTNSTDGKAGTPYSVNITALSSSVCTPTCSGSGLFCANSQPQNATIITNKQCCDGGFCYQCPEGSEWTAGTYQDRAWSGIAMSDDGAIRTAVTSNDKIYVSSDFGKNWNPKESSRYWGDIAMSSDGRIQTAVSTNDNYIFVSTDSGNSWPSKEAVTFSDVAMSSDGRIQTAIHNSTNAENSIYSSVDYGNTWTARDSGRLWSDVAMSGDGRIQTAVVYYGKIYVSSDYGYNWTAINVSLTDTNSDKGWWAVAMSDDGRIQTAVVFSGDIYVSADYGKTWNPKGPEGDGDMSWKGVAMSSDGKNQTAFEDSGNIYVSNDSGNTWSAKLSGKWNGIAMSSDGKIQSATYYDVNTKKGQIYDSSDYGKTWKLNETPGSCSSPKGTFSGESGAMCGTANNETFTTSQRNWGILTFCAKGNPVPSKPAFPEQGETVNWICQSLDGKSQVECFAKRDEKVCKPDDPTCAARTCKDKYCWNGCELIKGTSEDCD